MHRIAFWGSPSFRVPVTCTQNMFEAVLTVRHILVECNLFAQERKYIFGRRDVVESFRFQPTLIVLFLKQIKFYCTF